MNIPKDENADFGYCTHLVIESRRHILERYQNNEKKIFSYEYWYNHHNSHAHDGNHEYEESFCNQNQR